MQRTVILFLILIVASAMLLNVSAFAASGKTCEIPPSTEKSDKAPCLGRTATTTVKPQK